MLLLAITLLAASSSAPSPILALPESLKLGPKGEALSADEISDLEDGDVLADLTEHGSDPVKTGVAVAVIPGAPKAIEDVVADCDHLTQFMPYVAKCQVDVPLKDDQFTIHQWLEFPFGVGNRDYQIVDTFGTQKDDAIESLKLSWKYTGVGNIKDTFGSWLFTPLPDGRTLIHYTVNTDPGGHFPDWAKNKATKIALGKVVNATRKRVAALGAAPAK